MTLAANIMGTCLALVCVASSLGDFRRDPRIVASMNRLGVPVEKMPVLGVIKVLAALGIVVGFFLDRVHVLVGLCLALYFAIAVTAHVRVRDGVKHSAPAFVILVVAVAFALAAIGS